MSIKTLVIQIFFIFYFLPISNAQLSLNWAKSLGEQGEEYLSNIVTDQQANVYGVGHFQTTLSTLTSHGDNDVVVFKYDATGQLKWLTQLGSAIDDLEKDIAIDQHGNTYITGVYRSTLYYNNDSLLCQGKSDAFVAKIDSNGSILWLKNIGSTDNEIGNAISCDNSGNIYVSGSFEDSLKIDNQALNSYGILNNFLVKLDPLGNLIWHNSISTHAIDNIQDIQLDSSENIYLTGHFRDALYGTLGQLNSFGHNDVFIAKFTPNGTLSWWKKIGGTYPDLGFGLHIKEPFIYVTGIFQDTAYFDNITKVCEGEIDAFLAQTDMQGNINWVQVVGGLDNSKGFEMAALGNSVYWVGYFESTARWGSDSATSRDPRHVPSDIFIAEYAIDGSYKSLKTIGGLGIDFATSISIVDSNNIYIAGVYQDSVLFDSTLVVSYGPNSDMFIARYSRNNWTSIFEPILNKFNSRIFPNPVSQQAIVEFELTKPSKVQVTLYNALGQPLKKLLNDTFCNGAQQLVFDKQELVTGLYYIAIQTTTEQVLLPFLIN